MGRFDGKVVLVTGTQMACNRFFMKQESRGGVVFLSSNTAMRADHWLRHYVGTLTNVRPPDSMAYYSMV